MKNRTIYLILSLFIAIMMSCSSDDNLEDDNLEITPVNVKSVTDCELTIVPETLVSICANGTDFALRNEIITFASTFYSKNDSSSNTEFLWTIESGSMEIMNIENSNDELIAKSIVTIKFNSDFSGNGIIKVNANSGNSEAFTELYIGLE